MNNKYVIYILAAALTVSLVANEVLYGNMQSLQNDLKEYSDANYKMIQKASTYYGSGQNATITSP